MDPRSDPELLLYEYYDSWATKEELRPVRRSNWIGGAWFKRVCQAFREKGYLPPDPESSDTGPTDGAYAGNIASQYQAHLDEREVFEVIRSARTAPRR